MRIVVTKSSIILDGRRRPLDIRRTRARAEGEIQSSSRITRNSAHVRIRDFDDGIGVSCVSLAAYLVVRVFAERKKDADMRDTSPFSQHKLCSSSSSSSCSEDSMSIFGQR